MSRWFPERVVLHLGPGEANVLDAFERQLDERALARGTRLTCVLSAPWVRYRIVPWNAQASGAARRQLFAEHCFREAHGDEARAWTVRAAPPRHGQPVLACAVDTAVLDGLAARARSRSLALESVQPALMHGFNAARRGIVGDSYWVVLPEPAVLTVLLVLQGGARLAKVFAAGLDGLGRVLDREWFALGLEPMPCPVYVVGPDATTTAAATGWTVHTLALARG